MVKEHNFRVTVTFLDGTKFKTIISSKKYPQTSLGRINYFIKLFSSLPDYRNKAIHLIKTEKEAKD